MNSNRRSALDFIDRLSLVSFEDAALECSRLRRREVRDPATRPGVSNGFVAAYEGLLLACGVRNVRNFGVGHNVRHTRVGPTRIARTSRGPAYGMVALQEWLDEDLAGALHGWHLTSADDISADGRVIVGTGTNPTGQTEAWMIRLVDGPGPTIGDVVVGQFDAGAGDGEIMDR